MKAPPLSRESKALDVWRVWNVWCVWLALAGSGFGALAQPANAPKKAPAEAPVPAPAPAPAKAAASKSEAVSLNFVNADIDAVARTLATLTGRNVVVDPRVKGTLTLITEQPVTPLQAFNQFAAQLRLQGFAMVETAGLYKIVPEADAKLQAGAVSAGPPSSSAASGGNQIVTQIFRLNHEATNNLLPILRPLITPNNTITVNASSNTLVITDYADNLQRLARIIAALDMANASDLEVIALKNAIASDLVPLLIRLLEPGAGGGPGAQGDSSFRTTLLAEPRGNSVILRAANPARIALVRSLVEKLDRPPESGRDPAGNIHVVYLRNADATQLALTLRGAISADVGAVGATTGAAPAPQPPAPGTAPGSSAAVSSAPRQSVTGGQIQADPATNSLIITAPDPQYRQLRAVIDRLDARRAQVYVESLIVEVNVDKAAEFGIQWQQRLGKAGGDTLGVVGTNFGTGGDNIVNLLTQGLSGLSTDGVTPSAGLIAGALRRSNGLFTLGLLARALEQSGSGNILSTPNLLTLDNEEAKIVIGQNVPFITGRYTSAGTGVNGAINPFQTIERKDVGLTLRVRPQISESGTIKLVIAQEVSSVQPSSVNAASGPITNKRSIDSTVLVDDGGIVVLGGLLQDEYADNQDKVPLLGDLPLFGNLFKNQSRSRKKTNLMVFMRPVVVRDAQATETLSIDRYELMRGLQQGTQPAPSDILPINEVPRLPAYRGLAPAPTPPPAPGVLPASPPASAGEAPAPSAPPADAKP